VVVSLLARRAHSLSTTGAITGSIMGTIAIAAGWSWGALLLSMFISVTSLSRIGAAEKARRLAGVIAKGGDRDALQLLANGAVYSLAALGSLISPGHAWYAIGAGALSFSAADTWATEIGTLSRNDPRSIFNGRAVAPGTSGGITLLGTLGALGGAVFIALLTMFAGWAVSFTAVLLGGVLAAVADSAIGATVQVRRWCQNCRQPTERTVHDCGTQTSIVGGVSALNNDAVNGVCSIIGALIALIL
jgi:uncharacterized protein (TIGR00297 family)